MVPIAYALVPNKRQASYEIVLDQIRDAMAHRNLPLQLNRFCCDFEEGLRNTLLNRFPGKYFVLKKNSYFIKFQITQYMNDV